MKCKLKYLKEIIILLSIGMIIFVPTHVVKANAKDFNIINGVLISYTGDDDMVKVPNNVKEIGSRAFYDNVKKIVLPSSVSVI